MNKLRFLVCLLILPIAVSAQAKDPVEDAVRNALTQYDTAWNKKDAKAVEKMLADDYVYFTSTGGLTGRKDTLKFLGSPDYKLTFVERSEIVVHNTGTAVIVSSRWKGKGTFGKELINDDQRCGIVFIRDKKTWKILSEHCVQIAPASP